MRALSRLGATWLDVSTGSLIVANLVPLFGALFLGWNAGVILILYWAENLVVGFYSELKILLARGGPEANVSGVDPGSRAGAAARRAPVAFAGFVHLAKLFPMAFFALHYGGFCAVHGVFVYAFVREIGEGADFDVFPLADDWPGPLVFLQIGASLVERILANYGEEIAVPLLALFASHGVSFVQNYLLRRESKTATVGAMMGAPYARIVLMHVAIISAALPVLLFGSPLPLLAVLVLLKIAFDVPLHTVSHTPGMTVRNLLGGTMRRQRRARVNGK
jgi:hypothetical protein